ncbi:hypothetical protein FOL47_009250 [Perkinsus chesapeaki]|uniref:AB hydrolase-1 domain-containing protein n=1 Tax=Perkinsus chesapeaki TaxID=330153 RepID=A0A7J6L9G9_PERCH|nr:hypothetical protein FOL47_009250 [Perkinsus chesapeaki]
MTIFNHGNSNASGYQATSVTGTSGWLNMSDRKRYCSEPTIGIPQEVRAAIDKARKDISADTLEQRQRIAMKLGAEKPSHKAVREACVERIRQHILDKTLSADVRGVGSSMLGSTHYWRKARGSGRLRFSAFNGIFGADRTIGISRTHMKVSSLRYRNREVPGPAEYFGSFPSSSSDASGPQAKLQWRDVLSSSTNPSGFDSTKVVSSAKFSFPRTRRPDGYRIYHTVVKSNEDAPAKGHIVMIMGLAMPHICWAPQTAFLASIGYELLLVDNRGVGFSYADPAKDKGKLSMRSHTITSMAEDAIACVEACGWHDFHLMGVSMGGMIAQRLCLMIAQKSLRFRIKSLVLITTHCKASLSSLPSLRAMTDMLILIVSGGGGPLRDPTTGKVNADHPILRILFPRKTEIVKVFSRIGRESLPPDVADAYKKLPNTKAADVLKQIAGLLQHSVGEEGIRQFHDVLRMPILIVYGGKDKLVPPESSKQVARLSIPELTKVIELPESGHALMMQCEEELHAILRAHLINVDTPSMPSVSRL